VVAIQGASRPGRPIIGRPTEQDVTWGGVTIKKGAQLWPVGTDTAKATIYSRLNMAGQGAGVYHWPEGTPDDYFKQLTAEKLVTKFVRGYPKQEWTIEQGSKNHYLDAEVYAYAAAVRAGMGRPGFWDEVEKAVKSSPKQAKPVEEQVKSGYIPEQENYLR